VLANVSRDRNAAFRVNVKCVDNEGNLLENNLNFANYTPTVSVNSITILNVFSEKKKKKRDFTFALPLGTREKLRFVVVRCDNVYFGKIVYTEDSRVFRNIGTLLPNLSRHIPVARMLNGVVHTTENSCGCFQ
jgi:hypothetical protein